MKINKDLISIGIPSYNRPEYLDFLIKSILKQTYTHFEIIIYDDESPRIVDIRKVLESNNDPRIRFYEGKNKGFIKNWNRTLLQCKGAYIKIIGDDDILMENCLEEEYKILSQYSDVGFVCSDLLVINEKGDRILNETFKLNSYRIFNCNTIEDGKSFIKKYFLGARKIGAPGSIMFSRKVFNVVGKFDENIGSPVDIDYWLRISKKYKFYYIDKVLLSIRWHVNLSKKLEINIEHYSNLILLLNKHFPEVKMETSFFEKSKILLIYIYLSKRYINRGNLNRIFQSYKYIFNIIF